MPGSIFKSFNFNIGSLQLSPTYIQAGLIVFLLFLLLFSIAHMRRHFFSWSIKGATFGILFGFVFAFILEGFLIISGRSVLTELLGWKNAPKPIQNFLEASRSRMVEVLGAKDCQ